MSETESAIDVVELSHRYGANLALDQLSLSVPRGSIFAVLGPNGGGKTTLFRVLSTLMPIQQGEARILGRSVSRDVVAVRQRIGVVFQSPSLDLKLTARENLLHHAALYGLPAQDARRQADQMLEELGLHDRSRDLVETFSGGMRRRVELAKGMLHAPQVLLMDEPSTGLDPGVRSDLWSYLQRIRREQGVTIALTTHLLDEAERADQIAILDRGQRVALGEPDALREELGGETVQIQTREAASLADAIRSRFGAETRVLEDQVRLESTEGAAWVGRLQEAFGHQIEAITVGKPTLEDVFIARTGRRFWRNPVDEAETEEIKE